MRYFNRHLQQHKNAIAIGLFTVMLSACSTISGTDEAVSAEEQQAELKKIAKALVDETELEKSSTLPDNTLAGDTNQQDGFKPTEQSLEYQRKQKQMQQSIPSNVSELYQRALSAMQAEQWQQANDLFSQVIVLSPELSGSYLNQAIIAQKTQQLVLAQEKINQALKVNPISPYAHNLNGVLARQRGEFQVAEQSYLAALNSLPNYADAHLNLAILAELYQGKLVLAQQHYQAYLMIHQEDKQVQRWLAGLSLKLAQTSAGE
jgi:tetratricopeptide (TPR) repeat protein